MKARTRTSNNTRSPLAAYIVSIHGRCVSVPAQTPCINESMNAGTAKRWIPRHRFFDRRFFAQLETMTMTIMYIATMPNAMATGRKESRIGTSTSRMPNGMYSCSTSSTMCSVSSASPVEATTAWK